MHHRIIARAVGLLAVTATLAGVAACTAGDSATAPAAALSGPRRLANITLDLTTPLNVYIANPVTITTVGYHAITASASNGESGVYHFHWYHKICNQQSAGYPVYCESDWQEDFYPQTESGNTGTLNHYFQTGDIKTWLLVEVQDTTTNGRSGKDSALVWGPGEKKTISGANFTCNMGSQYPLIGFVYDSATHTTKIGTFNYRRNPCTGAFEKQ